MVVVVLAGTAASAAAQDRARSVRFAMPGVEVRAAPDTRTARSAPEPAGDGIVRKSAAGSGAAMDGEVEKIIKPEVIPIQDQALYEGQPLDKDWRSTLWLMDGTSRCTATAIGPRVLLTAAHCVTRRPRIEVDDGSGTPIALACTTHPRFSPYGIGRIFDYALCHLSRDFPRRVNVATRYSVDDLRQVLPLIAAESPPHSALLQHSVLPNIQNRNDETDVLPFLKQLAEGPQPITDGQGNVFDLQFLETRIVAALGSIRPSRTLEDVRLERLSLAPADGIYRLGDPQTRRLLMAGYGCTDRRQRGGNNGTLSVGIGLVSHFGPAWLTIGDNARRDSSILCRGDSGGPAFRLLSRDPTGPRRLVAINAYNISVGGSVQNRSFAVKLASPAFIGFFASWRRMAGGPRVCGVDPLPPSLCRE